MLRLQVIGRRDRGDRYDKAQPNLNKHPTKTGVIELCYMSMKNPNKRQTSRDEMLEIVAGAKQFKNILPLIEGDLQKSGVDVSALLRGFC